MKPTTTVCSTHIFREIDHTFGITKMISFRVIRDFNQLAALEEVNVNIYGWALSSIEDRIERMQAKFMSCPSCYMYNKTFSYISTVVFIGFSYRFDAIRN